MGVLGAHRGGGRRGAAAAALLLAACGLASPGDPPARTTGSGPDPSAPPMLPRDPATPETGSSGPPVAAPFPGYVLVWRDEFDGAAVDPARWNVRGGQWRDAIRAADSVAVHDGVLTLTTFTDGAGVHHTGYLETRGKLEPTYGYFEARMRLTGAPGEWCAFWVFPDTFGEPIGDPGTAGVELDIVEHRFTDSGGWDLGDVAQVGIGWDGFGATWKRAQRVVAFPGGAPIFGEWRTFGALWTPTGYTFYVDDAPVWSTSAAVSHRSQAVYLTCEVKDASWAGPIPAAGYGTRETSVARTDVDWVRVWQPRP